VTGDEIPDDVEIDQLLRTLEDGVDIDRAIGILMVLRDCDSTTAEMLLEADAWLSGHSIAAEARAIIDELRD
jgi:AmiR/NasT family two-component response regulator